MLVFIFALSSTSIVADSQNDTLPASSQVGVAPNTSNCTQIYINSIYKEVQFSEVYLFIDGKEEDYLSTINGYGITGFPRYKKTDEFIKPGKHTFTAMWRDPSTRRFQNNSVTQEIRLNELNKVTIDVFLRPVYNLKVSAKNENDGNIVAYLYVDEDFIDGKLLKEGWDSFESIEINSGSHEVSIRWLDPITNKEYQKKKKIFVDGEESLLFIATKGMSSAEPQDNETTNDSPEVQNNTESDQDIEKKEAKKAPPKVTSVVKVYSHFLPRAFTS
ncbi:MAG: hypothetical protein PHW87_03425, partial [Methanothrix sp.]|nr:hypothetical protein [Methanothrix sp.]